MKIQADKEGMKAIRELCDILFRAIGLQGQPFVDKVLPVLKELKEPPKEPDNNSGDESE